MGFIGRNPNWLVYHGAVLCTMTAKFDQVRHFTVDLAYCLLVKSDYRDRTKKEPPVPPASSRASARTEGG